jgi:hypothetical protein
MNTLLSISASALRQALGPNLHAQRRSPTFIGLRTLSIVVFDFNYQRMAAACYAWLAPTTSAKHAALPQYLDCRPAALTELTRYDQSLSLPHLCHLTLATDRALAARNDVCVNIIFGY